MPAIEDTLAELVGAAVDAAFARYLAVAGERLTYTVDEAAVAIGVSPTTVRKLITARHLPVVPHLGERRLIPRLALEAFVNGPSTSTPPAGRRRSVEDGTRLKAAS